MKVQMYRYYIFAEQCSSFVGKVFYKLLSWYIQLHKQPQL